MGNHERMARARAVSAEIKREQRDERLREYMEYRDCRYTIAKAAFWVGVSVWTAKYRYEPEWRAAKEESAA